MLLYVTRNSISHRGETVNKGGIIEENDRNHIGGLQSVGCQKYDEGIHGSRKVEPEPAEVEKVDAVEPTPEPVKVDEPVKAPEPKTNPPARKRKSKR